ncbi:uncharacterized protein [Physcomitrium patens]|uniref:uncharacterized protein isoform X13 n=1 Tax=Physcomitrium patens TaxID=3218 RepID=UPI003CCDB315
MVCVKVRERERRRALEVFVKALIGCILMEDIASVGTGCEGIRADLASGPCAILRLKGKMEQKPPILRS